MDDLKGRKLTDYLKKNYEKNIKKQGLYTY